MRAGFLKSEGSAGGTKKGEKKPMKKLARIKQIIPTQGNIFAMYDDAEMDIVTTKRVACLALVESTSEICNEQVHALVLDAAGRFVFADSLDGFKYMTIIGQ